MRDTVPMQKELNVVKRNSQRMGNNFSKLEIYQTLKIQQKYKVEEVSGIGMMDGCKYQKVQISIKKSNMQVLRVSKERKETKEGLQVIKDKYRFPKIKNTCFPFEKAHQIPRKMNSKRSISHIQ